MAETPQSRSRNFLRKRGFLVATVEAWRTFPERKKQYTCEGCKAAEMPLHIIPNFASVCPHCFRESSTFEWVELPGCASCGHKKEIRQRMDMFGYADICGIRPGCHVFAQTTSKTNLLSRVKKMLSEECREAVKTALEAGVVVEAHGWYESSQEGSRTRWQVAITRFQIGTEGLEAVKVTDTSTYNWDAVPNQPVLELKG